MKRRSIVNVLAFLFVKLAFYFLVALVFVLLMRWAEIVSVFSWKYVVVLTLAIFAFSVVLVHPYPIMRGK